MNQAIATSNGYFPVGICMEEWIVDALEESFGREWARGELPLITGPG